MVSKSLQIKNCTSLLPANYWVTNSLQKVFSLGFGISAAGNIYILAFCLLKVQIQTHFTSSVGLVFSQNKVDDSKGEIWLSVMSQGSVWEDDEGLAEAPRGWAKGLYLSGAGPWGGDGMGVSGEAAGWWTRTERHLDFIFKNKKKIIWIFGPHCLEIKATTPCVH